MRRVLTRRRLAVALSCLPAVAHGHAFTAGQGAYELFLDGASLPFHSVELALCVSAFGLLVGMWNADGMPIVWPYFISGVIAGLLLPRLLTSDPMLPLYALALLAALLAAVALPYPRSLMRGLALLAGALIAYGATADHGDGNIPAAAMAGVFFGANFFVAAIAGLASLPARRFSAAWPLIGMRIVASWLAAITMMMLAFAMRSPLS